MPTQQQLKDRRLAAYWYALGIADERGVYSIEVDAEGFGVHYQELSKGSFIPSIPDAFKQWEKERSS